jgi:hypothetical protein
MLIKSEKLELYDTLSKYLKYKDMIDNKCPKSEHMKDFKCLKVTCEECWFLALKEDLENL